MRKLAFLAGALLASTAVPAAAQYYGGGGNLQVRIEQLQARIQANVQSGRLTRGEAESLRAELRQLRQLERQFSQDGLSVTERDELQRRIQSLQQRVQSERRDGDYRDRDRDGRYDRDDRRDRDDRYDRDDDRDDDRYGRNCPPGLAKKNNGCLPPGQAKKMMREGDRYQEGMGYELPERYRYQYRDTNRYFHRYSDGRIYRIDRRTFIIIAVIVVVR